MSLDATVLTGVSQFADVYLAFKGKGLSREEALDLMRAILREHFRMQFRLQVYLARKAKAA